MKTTNSLANKFGRYLKTAARSAYPTHNSRNHRGAVEERHAQHYLESQGLRLITHNFRCRHGEIDLVMQDGETLVYVEVRQRKSAAYGSPLESVSPSKKRKLLKAAQYYAMTYGIGDSTAQRFDVVGLTGHLPNVTVDWVQNAFSF